MDGKKGEEVEEYDGEWRDRGKGDLKEDDKEERKGVERVKGKEGKEEK